MGTWSAEIFGNDTSCEVKEYFNTKYNEGEQIGKIIQEITDIYSFDIENQEDEDRYNILFALSYCLWETASLDDARLEQIVKIINSKKDINVLINLGADDKFLALREKQLQKFIAKISIPKQKAKNRVKPPQQIESSFKTGECLTFQYPDGKYGGIIIIDCEFYNNKGSLRAAITDIEQEDRPNFNTFLNSKLINVKWDTVYGQSVKFVAFDDKTARITTNYMGYEKSMEKQVFFDYYQRFFHGCGQLPQFTQCLIDTIGGSFDYSRKLNDYSYEEFCDVLSARLLFYKNNVIINCQPIVNERLCELKELLTKKK